MTSYKPSRGMLLVSFLEDAASVDPAGGIPAKVEAAGKGTDCEEGDTVLLKGYAKFGLKLSNGMTLVPELCVAAEVDEN